MAGKIIEFVEHEGAGAEAFFGKVVARTEVTGMTEAEVAVEVAEMLAIVGVHCAVVEVETVEAV